MDVARINCSHDDESTWLSIIENIHLAKKEVNAECKIYMDLMGPKLRVMRLNSPMSKKRKA